MTDNLRNEPVDLQLRIATKDEAVWEEVAKQCRLAIAGCERELLVQNNVLILAEQKIALEKAKTT